MIFWSVNAFIVDRLGFRLRYKESGREPRKILIPSSYSSLRSRAKVTFSFNSNLLTHATEHSLLVSCDQISYDAHFH